MERSFSPENVKIVLAQDYERQRTPLHIPSPPKPEPLEELVEEFDPHTPEAQDIALKKITKLKKEKENRICRDR